MVKKLSNFLWIMSIIFFLFAQTEARELEKSANNSATLNKATDRVTNSLINIGNWGYWFANTGVSAHDPFTGSSGGYFPRGTAGAIYRDGLVWGGIVDDPDTSKTRLRVGGNTYRCGTQPGWYGGSPSDDRARLYRIRLDWARLDHNALILDAAEMYNAAPEDVTKFQTDNLIKQYKTDWKEWPVDLGAPYYDVNDNGSYDPVLDENEMPIIPEYDEDNNLIAGGDYPGLADADQVVWFVINDNNSGNTIFLSGSSPIGLEVQTTVWAYNQPTTSLGQVVFKKYKILNKSGCRIDSMYACQWSDPDLGDYGDDLTGCDVDLSLMFAYNGYPSDNSYKSFNLPPAAVGYDFFQGPIVDGAPGDTAVFDLKKWPGKKNLPMTSYGYFGSGTKWTDPDMGKYTGTLQWFNLLRGYAPTDDIIDPTYFKVTTGPNEGMDTMFPLSGDPVTGEGDVDGIKYKRGDRRMLQSTGPFVMENGDVQEIVVAVIGGMGGDNIQSLDVLKIRDNIAQDAYNSLFMAVPKPPAQPNVQATVYSDKITLDWSWDQDAIDKTEVPIIIGYEFEGYNVYQLPSAIAGVDDKRAKRIATYDLVNGIREIYSPVFEPSTGKFVDWPVQLGEDTGIKRFETITKDHINDLPFYKGSTYHFAVTTYNYDPNLTIDRALESAPVKFSLTIQDEKPGDELFNDGEEQFGTNHETGVAGASVNFKVINPEQLTGDDYEVFFDIQHYYMDVDGEWKKTNYPDSVGKGLAKPGDLTGTTLSAIAYTSPNVGTRDLKFILDLVAPDYDWSDGVFLHFPPEIVINSAEDALGNGDGNSHSATIDLVENTVLWGVNDTSEAGPFAGGEVFTVNVNTPTLPFDVDYVVYDDGWAVGYGAPYDTLGDGVVHAVDTCTITEEGYAFKSVNHWNMRNNTTEEVVIEDRTDLGQTSITAPVVEGIQVYVDGSYASPVTFQSATLIKEDGSTTDLDDSGGDGENIGSYYHYGWGATAKATDPDVRGFGSTDNEELVQDYELRWTGTYKAAPTDVNGVKVWEVESGGSMVSLYDARVGDIAQHPLNPNPGSTDAFLVRVPFEVWNTVTEQQINFSIYDRIQNYDGSMEVYAFNPNGRMYTEFVNTPYDSVNAIPADGGTHADHFTWNLVWWNSDFVKGDIVSIIYANPIVPYVDTYKFSTKDYMPSTGNMAKMAADVEKINIFPNPYYAYNPQESGRFNRFVTFTHLPQKATLRIFNLAGTQVRKLEKDTDEQFLKWDLQNESGLPVGSGMYIVHIDMPQVSKVKVLKVMIIQSEQVLEYY